MTSVVVVEVSGRGACSGFSDGQWAGVGGSGIVMVVEAMMWWQQW
jgi:hypothetical protein